MRPFLITITDQAFIVFASGKREALDAAGLATEATAHITEAVHLPAQSSPVVFGLTGVVPEEWRPTESWVNSPKDAEESVRQALDRSHPDRSENKSKRAKK